MVILTNLNHQQHGFFVGRYPSLTSCATLLLSCQMIWNFFASSHRKGEVDGARLLCK